MAPRMAFAQIKKLGYKGSQLSLTGTIINVPANLDKVQLAFPRSLSETMTVAMMIKRKMEYKNAYLSGNIRPKHVMLALKDLCKTTLYKKEGISIGNKWEHFFDQLTQSNDDFLSNVEYLDSTNVDVDT